MKMKPKLPWRRQNIGDARSIAHLPRRAAIVKPSGPKPKTEAVCAGVARLQEGGYRFFLESSWQMLGKELQARILACWSLILLWSFKILFML